MNKASQELKVVACKPHLLQIQMLLHSICLPQTYPQIEVIPKLETKGKIKGINGSGPVGMDQSSLLFTRVILNTKRRDMSTINKPDETISLVEKSTSFLF